MEAKSTFALLSVALERGSKKDHDTEDSAEDSIEDSTGLREISIPRG